MKKVIIVEIVLIFAMACNIAVSSELFIRAYNVSLSIKEYSFTGYELAVWVESYNRFLTYAILALIAAVAIFSAIVTIAIKDFPVFKPLVNKLSAKHTARKEQRTAAKAEQTTIAKQQRIEKLQAELDELKKDE